MELSSYLKPISAEVVQENALGASMVEYSDSLDLHDFDVAILFVSENRWREEIPGDERFAKLVLEALGALYVHGFEPKVLSLGEFVIGRELSDSESGLTTLVSVLIEAEIVPIIIGGSRELTHAIYSCFEKAEQVVNLTAVDAQLNVEDEHSSGYVGRIIKEQPNYLFNYSNLGYQSYLVSLKELELAEELFFESYRLGLIRGNVFSAEPIIRGAELYSCSMESVKFGEFMSAQTPQPNGFYAEEICQLMRYAGLTDKNKVALVTDIDWKACADTPSDIRLVAEMIWCFLDGFYHRRPEMPAARKDGFLKYRVPLRDDEFQLIFYKSLNTDRWWMEVPVPPQYANKYRKHHLVPCDYQDYLIATADDLPERWWKAYKKML